MLLRLRPTLQRSRRKIERDLYWYDSATGDQYQDKGGKLVFHYDARQRKVIPCTADAYEISHVLNRAEMDKWLKNATERFSFEVIAKHQDFIDIDVNEDDLDDFSEEAYNNRFIAVEH